MRTTRLFRHGNFNLLNRIDHLLPIAHIELLVNTRNVGFYSTARYAETLRNMRNATTAHH